MLMLNNFLEMESTWRDVPQSFKIDDQIEGCRRERVSGTNRTRYGGMRPLRAWSTTCRVSLRLDIEARGGGLAKHLVDRFSA